MTGPRPRILIVDDDYAFAEYLKVALTSVQWDTSVCLDPLEAGDRVLSEKPDVVLLDFVMPEMNGVEVLAWLKDRRETRDIPVVVCSVNMDRKLSLEVSALGGAEVLKKPVNRADLIECLSRVLPRGKPPA